ncbi:MAG: heme ABC exporter ATP-binding protein CcmA [Pseudomonadota bacterium]
MHQTIHEDDNYLICRSVGSHYDDRQIFSNLSFSVPSGSLTQIYGANGSGKSTLLRLLVGLRKPDQGEISWQGDLWRSGWNGALTLPFFLDHHLSAHEQLSPRENLIAWHTLHTNEVSNSISINDALIKAGLKQVLDEPLRQLSFGQKRRAVLARLLITTSSWWFLDEPFNGLDQAAQQWLCTLLDSHVEKGGTVILTSHSKIAVKHSIDKIDLTKYCQDNTHV